MSRKGCGEHIGKVDNIVARARNQRHPLGGCVKFFTSYTWHRVDN